MPKKKNKNKQQSSGADGDDDWDALLEAEAKKNDAPGDDAVKDAGAGTDAASKEEKDAEADKSGNVPAPAANDAAAAFLAAQGLDVGGDDDGEGGKNKKKKKKKKTGGAGEKKEEEKVCCLLLRFFSCCLATVEDEARQTMKERLHIFLTIGSTCL